ncbi:hypothetical protein L218DRAFT_950048 [Marasmius fiardii PR-910]|nr:hypothetical protein L218DRAFT_950048 [Marasmius fiardii PR-910]
MGQFDDTFAKYVAKEDHRDALKEASRDLHHDYPNCHVVIYEAPNKEDKINPGIMVAPPGHKQIIRGNIQLESSSRFHKHRRYNFLVFVEGTFTYRDTSQATDEWCTDSEFEMTGSHFYTFWRRDRKQGIVPSLVEGTIRSVSLDTTPSTLEKGNLWLYAECQTHDGEYRKTRLDLQTCIYFNRKGYLRVNHSDVTGTNERCLAANTSRVRNIEFDADSLILRAECAYGEWLGLSTRWRESLISLRYYLRNNDGVLEFVHPYRPKDPVLTPLLPQSSKSASEWVHKGFEGLAHVAETYGGIEMNTMKKEWVRGCYPEGDTFIRRGEEM